MLLIRAVKYNSLVSYLLAKEEAKTPLSSPLWDGQWRLLFAGLSKRGCANLYCSLLRPVLVAAVTYIGQRDDLYRLTHRPI